MQTSGLMPGWMTYKVQRTSSGLFGLAAKKQDDNRQPQRCF